MKLTVRSNLQIVLFFFIFWLKIGENGEITYREAGTQFANKEAGTQFNEKNLDEETTHM